MINLIKQKWRRWQIRREHDIIDQTVGPERNQATWLCKCGGFFVVGYPVDGEVSILESTCSRAPEGHIFGKMPEQTSGPYR